jgi:hypothetical protein
MLAMGVRDAQIGIQVIDEPETDVANNTDPFPNGAQVIPMPDAAAAPWWLRWRIKQVLAT